MLKKTTKHKKYRNMVREDFDSGHPMVKLIESLVPFDTEMDQDARRRMMAHLYGVQRRAALKREPGKTLRLRPVLVPVAAVVILAVIALSVILPMALLDGGAPVVKAESAKLNVLAGKVKVKPPDSDWKDASDGMKITAGTSVKTEDESYASVSFSEGSRMRITDASRALVSKIETDSITIEHIRGGTYHRVNKGTHYEVNNEHVVLRALGTAFNVDNRIKDNLEILTVESAVEVKIGDDNPIEVAEGEVMVVSLSQAKNAAKQSVSREQLEDERLISNVKQDAREGFSTGIYEQVDVPVTSEETAIKPQDEPAGEPVALKGKISGSMVKLDWNIPAEQPFDEVVLLRSESSKPVYPDNRIASFADASIKSTTDECVQEGKAFQYRICVVKDDIVKAYSNTVVINIPSSNPEPGPASVSLVSSLYSSGVNLQWSVKGATGFSGYVLERVVLKAPGNSQTPVGYRTVNRFNTNAMLFTYADNNVLPGHTYSYRVGLMVDGSVMVYSNKVDVEVPGGMKF